MHFNFYHLLVVAVLAVLVHANLTPPGLRADDKERSNALFGILDNSIDFSAIVEAVMPRIKEWLVQKPLQSTFSSITNSSSVFKMLAEYVVESEGARNPNASFAYSSNENETTVEFEEGPVKEIKMTLIFRASERGFHAAEFHRHCDGKGATVTLVKAWNERMAAAYNSVNWGQNCRNPRIPNPKGFFASIDDNLVVNGGHSFQKHAANRHGYVCSYSYSGPYFGGGMSISNRCDENYSSSSLGPVFGYGEEGVYPFILFGSRHFRVLEYEVFQVQDRLQKVPPRENSVEEAHFKIFKEPKGDEA
jgi:hypothetical protein